MKAGEVQDLNKLYPLLPVVLNMIDQGENIDTDSPLRATYLMARQRGLVGRIGEDKTGIAVTGRGEEFRELRNK